MKKIFTAVVIVLLAIVAINAQIRVIQLFKGDKLIATYKMDEIDHIEINDIDEGNLPAEVTPDKIDGAWNIQTLYCYGGSHADWDGDAFLKLTDKDWNWNASTGSAAEEDNTLTFTTLGSYPNGNTYGRCVNGAGADGKYFDCKYIGKLKDVAQNIDLTDNFRKIPVGESLWVHDVANDTYTFTDPNGTRTTARLIGKGTYTVGKRSIEIAEQALVFDIAGGVETDDQSIIWQDYDKFVQNPQQFIVAFGEGVSEGGNQGGSSDPEPEPEPDPVPDDNIVGTWDIDNLHCYGGSQPGNGDAFIQMSDKPWSFNTGTGPAAEEDNTLTFTQTGVDGNGYPTGKCVNSAGDDGQYFDCRFTGNLKSAAQNIDCSGNFRKIPTGESTWTHDTSNDTYIFTASDGSRTTARLISSGTYAQNSRSMQIQAYALVFDIAGGSDTYDNDILWTDYDKFVQYPRQLIVTISDPEGHAVPTLKLSIADKNATAETKALQSNLWTIGKTGFMFGHHEDLMYGRYWYDESGRSDTKDVCGDYPGVYSTDFAVTMDDRYQSEASTTTLRTRCIKEAYRRGEVITACMHLNNPATGGDSWDNSGNVVSQILTDGNWVRNKYIQWLDRLADYALTQLKDDAGRPIPVLFRPFHEHTQSWSWWGSSACSESEFIALWQFTVKYLRDTKGVHQFLYAIAPQMDSWKNESDFLYRWPGDDYVDFIGMDCYHGYNPDTFGHNIATISAVANSKQKPCGVTEVGVEGFSSSNYWTAHILTPAKQGNVSLIVTWRNKYVGSNESDKHFFSVYKGHVSEDDFRTFYNDGLTIFSGDLPDMYKMAAGISVE